MAKGRLLSILGSCRCCRRGAVHVRVAVDHATVLCAESNRQRAFPFPIQLGLAFPEGRRKRPSVRTSSRQESPARHACPVVCSSQTGFATAVKNKKSDNTGRGPGVSTFLSTFSLGILGSTTPTRGPDVVMGSTERRARNKIPGHQKSE